MGLLVVIRVVILILPPVPAVLGVVSFAIADLTRDIHPRCRATTPATMAPAASRWCTPAATAIRGGAIIATFWAAIIAAITAVAAVTAILVGTTAALALCSVG
jgi:hypothetical protein